MRRDCQNNICLRVILLALSCFSFALSADLDTALEKIFSFIESPTMRSVAALVFVGIAVYMWKNLERWKEWGLNIAGAIMALLLILNARTVAGWFF